MDKLLKELETQLEALTLVGMSDQAEARCDEIIDGLSLKSVNQSALGLSWQVTSIAAAIVLLIGLSSGWWLGRSEAKTPITGLETAPEVYVSAFDLINERAWMEIEGDPVLYLAKNGEVQERRTEVDVFEETVLHRDSGKMVTVRITTRQPINEVTNQF
ncbi:hypothetical protein N9A78_02735 [Akkermansiaceae bacterium]|jgi:hypothetical protein|nr:hypothetical protein [Akkermansiaceae bacterium]|tara:strand:- start:6810 stop:7286 length:477 start_codon:yes stop_codon:yes gene_type:complete